MKIGSRARSGAGSTQHLADCGPCRNYIQQFRETIELAGRLAAGDLAPEDRAALLDAFRDWRG